MKFKKNFLLLVLVAANNLNAQITPTFSNVDYSGNNDIFQKMDIYIPPGLTAPAPVIVLFMVVAGLQAQKELLMYHILRHLIMQVLSV
jgi:hypothetical protein